MAHHLTGGNNNLRPYQRKALELALRHSGIVLALPTGTGKTLIGCAWACELLNRREARRILILTPDYDALHSGISAVKKAGLDLWLSEEPVK